MEKRNFIIFYTSISIDGERNFDSIQISQFGPKFLNQNILIDSILDEINDANIETVSITGIIELNEADFKNWIK